MFDAKFFHTIDGELATGSQTYRGTNPSTEEKLWEVPCATQKELEDTVESATRAFPAWSQRLHEKRCSLLKGYASRLLALENELTELLMRENGKPRELANRELHSAIECIRGVTTFTLPVEKVEDATKSARVKYVPRGVVAAICPWNFPLLLSLVKVASALVTGNCIIVKPSPFCPYAVLKAVEIGKSVFPPGVLQALGGDESLGPLIVSHPGINHVTFTGSIPTGKKIMESAAKTLKHVTLELGGNDAAIVREDIDIDTVAPKVALAAFKNSGQICVATKRVYVHKSIYEPFLKVIAKFTKTLKVGDPFSEKGVNGKIDLGPIQNAMQYAKVQEFLADCKANNHRFVTGGEDSIPKGKGFFIRPTIIASPPPGSKIVTEEPFGPILPIMPYTTEAEVIAATNNTNTGLGACIWSADIARAEHIASQLEVGSVYINSPLRPDWRVYFAGRKESGIGGERGLRGLLEYCDPLAIHVYK